MDVTQTALQQQLTVYRRRMGRARLGQAMAWAALVGAWGWLALAVADYAAVALPQPVLLGGGWTALVVAGAALYYRLARPSAGQVAALLDGRLDNRQRVVTAVERLHEDTPSAMVQAQRSSTADHLAALDPAAVVPLRVPWARLWCSAALLALAVGLVAARAAQSGFTPLQAGAVPVVLLTPQAVVAVVTPGDPVALAQQSALAQAALDRLARALSEQSVTQRAADSLRQGDYAGTAARLADVGRQNDQLSAAAKDALAESLNGAATDTPSALPLTTAEKGAAQALANGQYADIAAALQQLGDAVQATGGQVIAQQDIARSFPTATADAQAGQPGSPAQGAGAAAQTTAGAASAGNAATPVAAATGTALSMTDRVKEITEEQGKGAAAQPTSGSAPGSQSLNKPAEAGQTAQARTSSAGLQAGSTPAPDTTDGNGGTSGGNGHTRVSGPPDTTQLTGPTDPFALDSSQQAGQTRAGEAVGTPALTMAGNGHTGANAATGSGSGAAVPGETNHPPVERWDVIRQYFTPDQQ